MALSKRENILIVLLATVVIIAGVFFILIPKEVALENARDNQAKTINQEPITTNEQITEPINSLAPAPVAPDTFLSPSAEVALSQKLSNPPEIIKAVYVTAYSAGSKKYLSYLDNIFKNTEINAVVIDIKDSSGYVSYASGAPDVRKYNLYSGAIKDIDALVKFFHDRSIYVIGRIAVFEDPLYSRARPALAIYNETEMANSAGSEQANRSQPASLEPDRRVLWQDNNGLSWLDPASKEVWDYNISLAKDAFLHGFDEINFDYIRFPSDGKIMDMGFPVWDEKTPEATVIKNFFQHLRAGLSGEKISADLFGQTTTSDGDMGIGQIIENAFENFDYISPMVYPSHYASRFMDFDNPAEHPYEVIKYSMLSALIKEIIFLGKKLSAEGNKTTEYSLAEFRPWLQDFNMGADYTVEMVKAEIQATQDALGSEYSGFMLWNPSNIYTQGAVSKPN